MEEKRSARERVIEAARRLFAEHGYEGTTMDQVATAAGVSKATLYRHVAGKEALAALAAPADGAGPRGRDARARLLEATMELVTQQGYARTSLDEIAAAAGVSKGAIYWHFTGKGDLIAAIIADYSPLPRLMELLQATPALPPERLLAEIYAVYFDFLSRHVSFLLAVISEVRANGELAAVFRQNVVGPILGAVGGYLARAPADHPLAQALETVHPVLALQALVGPLVAHVLMRDVVEAQLGLRFEPAEVRAALLDIFFHGILPPAARIPHGAENTSDG